MPLTVVGTRVLPCQIDDFPADCERSVKGSLHIKPGSSLSLSYDELAHIEEKHQSVFKCIRVVETPALKLKPVEVSIPFEFVDALPPTEEPYSYPSGFVAAEEEESDQ